VPGLNHSILFIFNQTLNKHLL